MNIFAVNPSAKESARQLPLKLVIKMPTETAQLLTCVFSKEQLISRVPYKSDGTPYRHFNPKHPCSIWIKESYGNFIWALKHGVELCGLYQKLYKREHGTTMLLTWLAIHQGELLNLFKKTEMTPFAQAMPEKYKNEDPHLAYRNYMVAEKSHYAKWATVEQIPDWWPDKSPEKFVDKSFVNGIYTKRYLKILSA